MLRGIDTWHTTAAPLAPALAGEWVLGGGWEAILGVCGRFFPSPEPVIYKLIELLMKPPEIRASVVRSQLCPPAFPTVCDLNTGNLEEGEGVSAELTYFAGPGLSSFPSPQQMGLLVPAGPNLHNQGPELRLRPPPQAELWGNNLSHRNGFFSIRGCVLGLV